MSNHFKHYRQLDGWRGLSIILVLVGHTCSYSLSLPEPFNQLGELASLGVLCFFILSGFLITGLLLQEEQNDSKISFRNFYLRRVLRIIPAYYSFLAVVSALICFGLVKDTLWKTVVISVFFLRDLAGQGLTLGHTWSLSIEEQFYLFWPVILSALSKKYRVLVVIISCLIAPIWRLLAISLKIWTPHNPFRPDFRFDCILLGCLIALLSTTQAKRLRALSPNSTGFFGLLIILLGWTLFASSLPQLIPFYLTIQLWLTAALLAHLVSHAQSPMIKAFGHPVLGWFGKISYSLYLWQQLFVASKTPSWGPLRVFPIDLICSLAIATLSYYCIELPFLRLKAKLSGL
jgi:peptidoglycan/LPS O-acetylase OafA/YrhL